MTSMQDSNFQQRFVVQTVGTETLIYDEARHKAFCLNQVSGPIWKLAGKQLTVKQLADAASKELQHPITEEVVRFALTELDRDGLLEDGVGLFGVQALSRREMVRKLGVGAVLMMPMVMSVFAPTSAFAASAPHCGDDDGRGGHFHFHGDEEEPRPEEGRHSTLDPMDFSGRSSRQSQDFEGVGQEETPQ